MTPLLLVQQAIKDLARSKCLKYSPDQPRVPPGSPDGGQWTSGGGEQPGESLPSEITLPPGYTMEVGQERESETGHWITFRVHDKQGRKVGELELQYKTEGNSYRIREASVDQNSRGLGIGKALYSNSMHYATSRLRGLTSDYAITKEADRVWSSLQRAGYPVERNAHASFNGEKWTVVRNGIRVDEPVWRLNGIAAAQPSRRCFRRLERIGTGENKAATLTALERIANRLSPSLRKRFLAAVEACKQAVNLERLAQAVQSGNLTQAEFAMKLREWPERFGELAIDLRAGFQAGMHLALDSLPRTSVQLRMDLINPYAVNYAERHLPQIVQRYVADARDAIRALISEAVSGRHTVQGAARIIKDSIGLHPQYERAVSRFRDLLVTDGITGERLEAKVEKYTQKLLKARATTIARTEIVQAQVSGQRALWNEAATAGMFNRQTATRIWRTNHEGFTNRGNPTPCPVCAPMNGQEISFTGVFLHPELGHQNVFGDELIGPPLHPNCLCHEELKT